MILNVNEDYMAIFSDKIICFLLNEFKNND